MEDPVGDLVPTNWNRHKKGWPHLADVPFGEFPPGTKVDMILGIDNPLFHWSLRELWGDSIHDPFARLTALGWTGYGPISVQGSSAVAAQAVHSIQMTDLPKIRPDEGPAAAGPVLCNAGDKRAVNLLQNTTVVQEDGKVATSLLWKEDGVRPAPNGEEIRERYRRDERRLESDPEMWQRYDAAISKWEANGFIKELPGASLQEGHYIPHFGVIREDKATTKLRVVLNCAYKNADGFSINDFLLKGPRIFNELVNVLLLFRRYPVALIGDIKEMFLQLKLLVEEREYVRILYRRYGEAGITVFECLAHMFGLACSPCIAVLLFKLAALLRQELDREASEAVIRQSIIDDILACVLDVSTGLRLKTGLILIAASLGMKIHKWASNIPALMSEAERNQESLEFKEGDPEKEEAQALGLLWLLKEDCFTFKERVTTLSQWTLRGALSFLNSQYDPMGLVLPFIMRGRMLFTQTRKAHREWEDLLTEEEKRRLGSMGQTSFSATPSASPQMG